MNSSLSKKAKAIISAFVTVSGLLITVTVGAYFVTFAPLAAYRVSGANQDWAQFGDYLAGTLGTIFSLLAFMGVLCTVWLQATQLDLAGKQAALDEIQRVLANVSARIDDLLSEHIHHNHPHRTEPANFFRVLSSGGTAALSIPTSDLVRQRKKSWPPSSDG